MARQNILNQISADRRAVDDIKSRFTSAEWKLWKGHFERVCDSALPILAGLQASAEIGKSRYQQCLANWASELIEAVNEWPTINGILGGNLVCGNALVEQFVVVLDMVLADLGWLVLRLQPPDPLPNQRIASEFPRVTEEVKDLAEFNNRWKQLQHHNLDFISFLFCSLLISDCRSWSVGWRIEGGGKETMATEHLNSVEVLELKFRSSTESSESPAPSEQVWRELFVTGQGHGESKSSLGCFASIYAHPQAIHAAANQLMAVHSGIFALCRSDDPASDRRIYFEGDPDRPPDARLPDHVTANGWAFAQERSQPTVVEIEGISDYSTADEVESDIVLLPRDEQEIAAAKQLIGDLPFMHLAFFSTMPLGLEVDRLRKSMWFWTQAEVMHRRLLSEGVSPHRMAAAFLSYCSVLEVSMGAKSAVTETISSRAAALMSSDASERCEKWRELKGLYDLRSRYVHEGDCRIRRPELVAIRRITRSCLRYFVQWLRRESDLRILRHGEGLCDLIRKHFTEGLAERVLIEKARACFPEDEFGKHCDLLRFGASLEQLRQT